jgi:hypothetical protein
MDPLAAAAPTLTPACSSEIQALTAAYLSFPTFGIRSQGPGSTNGTRWRGCVRRSGPVGVKAGGVRTGMPRRHDRCGQSPLGEPAHRSEHGAGLVRLGLLVVHRALLG